MKGGNPVAIDPAKLQALRDYIKDLERVKKLRPGDPDAAIWFDDVAALIGDLCGRDSEEYASFVIARQLQGEHVGYPGEHPAHLIQRVTFQQLESVAKVVLNRLVQGRAPTPRQAPPRKGVAPKVFISHGPPGPHLAKLKDFLVAAGVEPVVAEEQPSQGRSVVSNVDKYAGDCEAAIVLATRDRQIDGNWEPNPGVLVEIGDLRERFKGKIVYMVQEGLERAPMWAEHVYISFGDDCMDEAFTKLLRELKAANLI